jgi:hypothetical protein
LWLCGFSHRDVSHNPRIPHVRDRSLHYVSAISRFQRCIPWLSSPPVYALGFAAVSRFQSAVFRGYPATRFMRWALLLFRAFSAVFRGYLAPVYALGFSATPLRGLRDSKIGV